jgi:hypothetical protein
MTVMKRGKLKKQEIGKMSILINYQTHLQYLYLINEKYMQSVNCEKQLALVIYEQLVVFQLQRVDSEKFIEETQKKF